MSSFSFEEVPSPDQRVNETLARLKLPGDVSGLSNLMQISLSAPSIYCGDKALAMKWDSMVRADLEKIERSIRTAVEYSSPYAKPGALSAEFLCAAAMLDLPGNGRMGVNVLDHSQIAEIRKPVIKGYYIYSAFATLEAEKLPQIDAFQKLLPEARLLTELFATEACVRAMTAQAEGSDATHHARNVRRLRPLMMSSDSAMAYRFRMLSGMMDEQQAAPVTPLAPAAGMAFDPDRPRRAVVPDGVPTGFDAPNVVALRPRAARPV